MTTYLDLVEDSQGDLVDILYYCSFFCTPEDVRSKGSWPCPDYPDYDIFCSGCGTLMHKGTE